MSVKSFCPWFDRSLFYDVHRDQVQVKAPAGSGQRFGRGDSKNVRNSEARYARRLCRDYHFTVRTRARFNKSKVIPDIAWLYESLIGGFYFKYIVND